MNETDPFPQNAIYAGRVWHKRLSPSVHAFAYNIFYCLIDLDDFENTPQLPWCLSFDRFNLFSIWQKDYNDKAKTDLKTDILHMLQSANIDVKASKIYMLTMPRVLGYGFNPITLFYALDEDGQISGIIYEVHNTFGESHSYVFPMSHPQTNPAEHDINKSLYVSPFYEVTGKYKFQTSRPSEQLNMVIQYLTDANDIRMIASLSAKRIPLSAGQLIKKFFTIPLVTLKVITAIHFEALRLWIKRVPLVPRPAPPSQPYSATSPNKKPRASHD